MRAKHPFDTILPAYTRIPLVALVCANFLAYYVTRPITRHLVHWELSLPVDAAIPFVPAFIAVYLLAYLQWIVGYVLVARDSRGLCFRILSGGVAAKLLCMAAFLLLPTTMVRGDVSSGGLWNGLTALVYRLDAPDNLFPSIHCMESWLCFRGALELKKVGRWYAWASLAFTLLVFASVVLVKQHVAVDILGGVLAAELGLALARRTHAAAVLERLEARLSHPKS